MSIVNSSVYYDDNCTSVVRSVLFVGRVFRVRLGTRVMRTGLGGLVRLGGVLRLGGGVRGLVEVLLCLALDGLHQAAQRSLALLGGCGTHLALLTLFGLDFINGTHCAGLLRLGICGINGESGI